MAQPLEFLTRLLLASASHERPGMKSTILVVDDEPAIVELVRFTLEDEHVDVLEAADGAEALKLARAVHPDLIFLDVRIPELSGFEVCRAIRQDPALSRTAIVMLTALGQEGDRARGRAAGADDYLTKPFSPLALLRLARTLLPETVKWPGT